MIVLTTPTGQIGSQLLSDLLSAPEPVRVIVRDPARLPADLPASVEVVVGSHGDAEVVDRALEGADALFWNAPTSPDFPTVMARYVDFARPAAEAVRRHGVGHVVAVSALGRGYGADSGYVSASIAMTGLLESSGAATRSLANPGFIDNLLRSVGSIAAQGVFFGTHAPDHAIPQVATRDIAAAAAGLLSDRSWGGHADVDLLGPEDLSFDEVAAILTGVLGRPVRYQPVSLEDFATQLRERGMSEPILAGMIEMLAAKNDGLDELVTRTPENTTPTSLREWAETVLRPAVAQA